MDTDILGVFSSLYHAFFESRFFFYIKLVSAFAIFVLLIADILLLSKRIQADVKVAIYGANVPRLKKTEYAKKWESILNHLREGTVSSGKIALVEANKMLDEVLGKVGFKGANLEEKIGMIKPGQIVGISEVTEAHELYKKIIENPAHEVEMGEIKKAVDDYEKVFRGLELLN